MAELFGFISSTISSTIPHLTPRQLEVLALLGEGLPNKMISRRLGISAATAKAHVSGILRTLNARSRLEAVLVAHRIGLVASRISQGVSGPALGFSSHTGSETEQLARI